MKTAGSSSSNFVKPQLHFRRFSFLFCALLFVLSCRDANAQTPAKGETAPDFTLSTLDGVKVQLSGETSKGTTVFVILRGYPGYQCPFCQKQAHDFIAHASEFAKAKTTVLLVYPGPPAELDRRAKEFLTT
jgi:hypothetical protein